MLGRIARQRAHSELTARLQCAHNGATLLTGCADDGNELRGVRHGESPVRILVRLRPHAASAAVSFFAAATTALRASGPIATSSARMKVMSVMPRKPKAAFTDPTAGCG